MNDEKCILGVHDGVMISINIRIHNKMMRFVKHARTLLNEHNLNIDEYY